jgi:putative ABC transport system permease protein
MNDIFGVSMTAIMSVLVVLLSLCLLSVAWVAWRRPVLFKLGVRNIPRRRAQSTLIVVGLMLSTLIMSTALGVGDTVDHSATAAVYNVYGHVDEVVIRSADAVQKSSDAISGTVDADALALVDRTLAGDPNVDGVMPFLDARVPVINEAAGQVEPSLVLTGIDPSRLDGFGGLPATDGGTIDLAGLGADEVVISEGASDQLSATVGSTLVVYHDNTPITLTVAAITENSFLTGHRAMDQQGTPGRASLVMPLDRLQALTGQEGTLTGVAISNAGGIRDSDGATDAVMAKLAPMLEGKQLGVQAMKRDNVELANEVATIFTGLFLVLGLFSVAAGVLLIVLIFTMLAAERRSEMGMARAVGTHRRQLIQQFVAEGSGYALLSGVVGAALGVLATIGIAGGLRLIVGEFLSIEPRVTPRSLVVAYSLGMVITFLTVVGSSWKVSRLNVVAAVRDIPEVHSPKRRKSGLVWGVLFLIGGAFLALQGLGADKAFTFYAGMSILPFGVARVARFFGAPGRPVYTAVGLFTVVLWLLPQDVAEKLFGTLDGDMEMFFLSGIFMVIGATMVTVQNLDVLLAGINRLGGVFRSTLPAVRTAIAYPGAARGRTGLTIAMFSLIVFSLVMIATMNHNYVNLFLGDEANAGWDVRADAQGANPIADFGGTLAGKGVDTGQFSAVGTVTSPSPIGTQLRLAGEDEWKQTYVGGMDSAFIDGAALTFQQRAEGYATDADVIAALQQQPNVAVVDVSAVPQEGNFGGPDTQFLLTDLTVDDKTFTPIPVELAKPDGGITTVTIIGVIDSNIGSMIGLFAGQPTIDATYGDVSGISYFVALRDPGRSDEVAKSIEAALVHNGVQGVSIRDELKDQQQQEAGFLYLIQGFMGLGLVVGIAAVGVIAFRSVVERRQQIGVLRALGYQRGMVSLSFLIETVFLVGLGGFAGTALGLVLARNLFTSDAAASSASFTVPWTIIIAIAALTNVAALLMTWIPAAQAGRIAPAEALRYE